MYCKECGKKLPDDAMFCDECGTKVEEDVFEETVGNNYQEESIVSEQPAENSYQEEPIVSEQPVEPYKDQTVSLENVEENLNKSTTNYAQESNQQEAYSYNNDNNQQYSNSYNSGNNQQNSNFYNSDNKQNSYTYDSGNNHPPKKKSKTPVIITIVIIIAVLVMGAGAYVGFTIMKQKTVENSYESVKRKIETENIVLSDDSKEKLNEANKNIASWNLFTLNGTERQLDELKETVEEIANATDDLKEVQDKFDQLRKDENDKGVYCESEREKAQETLDDLKDSVNSNNVQAIDSKKKDAESALDDYEKAIKKAYDDSQNSDYSNDDDDYDYNNYDDEDYSNQISEVSEYVISDTDSFSYSKNALESFFNDLDLDVKDKYALSIIAVNEIYARYNVTFSTQSLNDYFNTTSWYSGSGKKADSVSLSDAENKNKDFLSNIRQYYWQECHDQGLVSSSKPDAKDFTATEYKEVMVRYTQK